jgi:hypothetical protein
MVQLGQKMVVLWIIGSSVKVPKFDELGNELPVVPEDAALQLVLLGIVQALQVLFILIQLPFNERFENIVQVSTAAQQGAFFIILGMTSMGVGPEEPGAIMNYFNLAGMSIVILASLKTQIFGMRKLVVKMRKNLVMCYKQSKKFAKDPYGYVCGPPGVADLRPFTDSINADNYLCMIKNAIKPYVFEGDARKDLVAILHEISDETKDTWTYEHGAICKLLSPANGAMLHDTVLAMMNEHSDAAHPPDESEDKEHNILKAAEKYFTDTMLMQAAHDYSRDYSLAAVLLNSVSFYSAHFLDRLVAASLSHPDIAAAFQDQEKKEEVIQLFQAQIRSMTDTLNLEIQKLASEEGVHDWPPVNGADVCAWERTIAQLLKLEPAKWQEALKTAYKIDTVAKSEAKLFLAFKDDEERRHISKKREEAGEDGLDADEFADFAMGGGFSMDMFSMDGEGGDDEEVEPDDDDFDDTIEGETAAQMKARLRKQKADRYAEKKAIRQAKQKVKGAKRLLKGNRPGSEQLVNLVLYRLDAQLDFELIEYTKTLIWAFSEVILNAHQVHPPVRAVPKRVLYDATSQAEITQLLDTIADEQGMAIIKDAKTVVRDLREVAVACADACAIRMKIKLHEFWIQDTSCAGFVPFPGSQNFIMAAANMQAQQLQHATASVTKIVSVLGKAIDAEAEMKPLEDAMASIMVDYYAPAFADPDFTKSSKDIDATELATTVLTSMAGQLAQNCIQKVFDAADGGSQLETFTDLASGAIQWALGMQYILHHESHVWSTTASTGVIKTMVTAEAVTRDYLSSMTLALVAQTTGEEHKEHERVIDLDPEMFFLVLDSMLKKGPQASKVLYSQMSQALSEEGAIFAAPDISSAKDLLSYQNNKDTTTPFVVSVASAAIKATLLPPEMLQKNDITILSADVGVLNKWTGSSDIFDGTIAAGRSDVMCTLPPLAVAPSSFRMCAIPFVETAYDEPKHNGDSFYQSSIVDVETPVAVEVVSSGQRPTCFNVADVKIDQCHVFIPTNRTTNGTNGTTNGQL